MPGGICFIFNTPITQHKHMKKIVLYLLACMSITACDHNNPRNNQTTPDALTDNYPNKLFDTNGNLVRNELDRNNDGSADYIETWAYDVNGNIIQYEQDTNGDGIPEFTENDTWLYDSYGNQTYHEKYNNLSDTPLLTETWEYNGDGNPVYYLRDSHEEDSSLFLRQTDQLATWSYNNSGAQIRHESGHPDSFPETIEIWTYYESEEVLSYDKYDYHISKLHPTSSWVHAEFDISGNTTVYTETNNPADIRVTDT